MNEYSSRPTYPNAESTLDQIIEATGNPFLPLRNTDHVDRKVLANMDKEQADKYKLPAKGFGKDTRPNNHVWTYDAVAGNLRTGFVSDDYYVNGIGLYVGDLDEGDVQHALSQFQGKQHLPMTSRRDGAYHLVVPVRATPKELRERFGGRKNNYGVHRCANYIALWNGTAYFLEGLREMSRSGLPLATLDEIDEILGGGKKKAAVTRGDHQGVFNANGSSAEYPVDWADPVRWAADYNLQDGMKHRFIVSVAAQAGIRYGHDQPAAGAFRDAVLDAVRKAGARDMPAAVSTYDIQFEWGASNRTARSLSPPQGGDEPPPPDMRWEEMSPEERVVKIIGRTYRKHANRHKFLYHSVRQLTKWNLPIDAAVETAISRGLTRDDEFEHHVTNGIQDGLDDRARRKASRRTAILDHTQNTVTRILQCVKELGFDVRYNRRRRLAESKVDGEAEWRLYDMPSAYLRQRIEDKYCLIRTVKTKDGAHEIEVPLTCSDRLLTAVLAILADRQVVDTFWESRPASSVWDGKPRLDTLVTDLFDLEDDCEEARGMAAWLARYTYIGALYRADKPGRQIVRTPILSDQGGGSGKSLFCSMPFSQEEHDAEDKTWFRDALEISDDTKKMVEATQGGVIVEMAECIGVENKRYQRHLKAFLVRSDDGQVRLAFRKNPTPHLRDIIIIGTADKGQFLSDDPNVRRFGIIQVKRKFAKNKVYPEFRAYFDAHREQLWAEAMHRYEQGELPHLPEHLYDYADAIATASRISSSIAEDVKQMAYNPDQLYTLKEIGVLLEYENFKGNNKQGKEVQEAMIACGWTVARDLKGKARKSKNATLYQPPPTNELDGKAWTTDAPDNRGSHDDVEDAPAKDTDWTNINMGKSDKPFAF